MPTYDYICLNCKYEWEEDQKISDPKKTKCPKCEEEKAQRQISGSGAFILNGPRWAVSGYT